MGQVAAVVEPHGEDGRSRFEQRLVDGQVGVGAGVRLHVGVVGPEQRGGPVAGQVLHLVDDPVAAVVAPAGVALGVLVRQHRARGGQHGRRREVLRGDQLQGRLLPVELLADEAGHLGIGGQRGLVAAHAIPSTAGDRLGIASDRRAEPTARMGIECTGAPGRPRGVNRYAPRSMALDPRTPVVVGVGQVATPPDAGLDPTARPEPLDAHDGGAAAPRRRTVTASRRAGRPRPGAPCIGRADSIRVVASLGWSTPNPARLVAARLGFAEGDEPAELMVSSIGGNNPQALMHDACLAISRGERDVVLVTGAEAMYARALARRDPARPWLEWTSQPEGTPPAALFGVEKAGATELEMQRGVVLPVHAYPLFENALRAANGWTLPGARAPASARCGRASARWRPATRTRGSAAPARPTRSSRPGRPTGWCRSPTPSSARPTCRSTRARPSSCARPRPPAPPACPRSAGSSRSPAPTATTTGSSPSAPSCTAPPPSASPVPPPSSRPGWASTTSPSSTSTRASRSWCRWRRPSSGLAVDDPDRPLTLTGGLTFGGGPGNNYTSHGIAQAVGALRARTGQRGTRQRPGVVRHQALPRGLRRRARRRTAAGGPSPGGTCSPPSTRCRAARSTPDATGAVRVETYTVTFDRDGAPERGILACRTADGSRAWGNVSDADTLALLCAEEGIGRTGDLAADGTLTLTG